MIHVAVLIKPYMDMVLAGTKTVECRLTRDARDPYERVERGERIYFKQSAGPYRATAIAEHVLFESDLTPRRVAQLRRDYNELIGGDEPFWRWKRDARFATLIWLREVEATDSGPAVRPLQGVAWLCLEEEPAWRRVDGQQWGPQGVPNRSRSRLGALSLSVGIGGPHRNRRPEPTLIGPPQHRGARNGSFAIQITAGNLRNNTLYVTSCADCFPAWAMGGSTRSKAGRPLTLILHDGPIVQTDIVGPRRMLRTRVWGRWFRRHGARPGDLVVFTPADASTWFVGLSRGGRHAPAPREASRS